MSVSAMSTTKPTGGVASTKHFELPALDLKFGSLTEGTNIPPPLPSPKEELPVLPKAAPKKEEKKVEDYNDYKDYQQPKKKTEPKGAVNGTSPSKPDMTIITNADLKRTAEEVPLSPVSSTRGSLRRFFGKSSVNHAYDEQGSAIGQNTSRPPSRSASTITDMKKAKRGSGWFRRLRFHDSATHDSTTEDKPAALQFEEVKSPKLTGPPPPMIPELTALKTKIDTNLGDDLFKGIGRD
ncbi:hypothetical protein F4861DRAFT_155219 [Xylaria intraflava]|nr:hypothetical protein F4861DRAFT_155219 [Xylaria intraflava]